MAWPVLVISTGGTGAPGGCGGCEGRRGREGGSALGLRVDKLGDDVVQESQYGTVGAPLIAHCRQSSEFDALGAGLPFGW